MAASIGVSPDYPQKPPSVYETWAMQHKRTKHVEWWSDNREGTANYTPNGLPIDGLITYVSFTVRDVADSQEQLDHTPLGHIGLMWVRTYHGGITPIVMNSLYLIWHQGHSLLVSARIRRSICKRQILSLEASWTQRSMLDVSTKMTCTLC